MHGRRLMLSVAPTAVATPNVPSVGIFWKIRNVLVIDRSSLEQAEPYGDCLTHAAGHYERWEEWQRLGATGLQRLGYPVEIATTEYDDWPRGRLVHEVPRARFVLYADRRIQNSPAISALIGAFALGGQTVVVESDSHYQ